MKELKPQEQRNVDFLTDKEIKFCLVQLTETSLKKSIFDATSQVRDFLKSEGIHDFSAQQKGPENKVVVKTHILTFRRVIDTETSMYRAVTRGDERMWFGSPIVDVTKPDEVYAIFSKEGEIYLINISTPMSIDSAWKSSVPNPIQEFISYKIANPNQGVSQLLITPPITGHNQGNNESVETPQKPNHTPQGSEPTQSIERKIEFIKYLRSKDMAIRTIKAYTLAPDNSDVKAIIFQEFGLPSLYDIHSLEQAKRIYKVVCKKQFNKDGHNMYSVAIHHYCKFLETLQQPIDLFTPKVIEQDSAELIEQVGNPMYISASEAAEIAGVTPETIRYLCKEGVMRFQHKSHMYFPCREDVFHYAKSIAQIHVIRKDIEHLEFDLKGQREAIRLQCRRNKKYLAEIEMSPQRLSRISELVYALLQSYEEDMKSEFTEREIELLFMMYRGVSFPEASEKMKLTNARARQIWAHLLRKLAVIKNEIKKRDEEIASLRQIIEKLQNNTDQQVVDSITEMWLDNVELLLTPIDKLNFSTRTERGLLNSQIYTVLDLVQCKRKTLRGARFIGKKTLNEIDDWLDAHHLDYGMVLPHNLDIEQLRTYLEAQKKL